jgi:hypothetical protein
LIDWFWTDLKARNMKGALSRRAMLRAASPRWGVPFLSRVALLEGRTFGERYVPRPVYLFLRRIYRSVRERSLLSV